jgi:hypothetical protein
LFFEGTNIFVNKIQRKNLQILNKCYSNNRHVPIKNLKNIFEQTLFEQMLFEQMLFEQMLFEQMLFEQMLFEQMLFEQMLFEQTSFEQMTFTNIKKQTNDVYQREESLQQIRLRFMHSVKLKC